MAEIGRGEGLPVACASCRKIAEMGRENGLFLAVYAINCPKIAKMEGWEGPPRAAVKC